MILSIFSCVCDQIHPGVCMSRAAPTQHWPPYKKKATPFPVLCMSPTSMVRYKDFPVARCLKMSSLKVFAASLGFERTFQSIKSFEVVQMNTG